MYEKFVSRWRIMCRLYIFFLLLFFYFIARSSHRNCFILSLINPLINYVPQFIVRSRRSFFCLVRHSLYVDTLRHDYTNDLGPTGMKLMYGWSRIPSFFFVVSVLKSIIETQNDTYWYEVEDNDDNDGKTPQKKKKELCWRKGIVCMGSLMQ